VADLEALEKREVAGAAAEVDDENAPPGLFRREILVPEVVEQGPLGLVEQADFAVAGFFGDLRDPRLNGPCASLGTPTMTSCLAGSSAMCCRCDCSTTVRRKSTAALAASSLETMSGLNCVRSR